MKPRSKSQSVLGESFSTEATPRILTVAFFCFLTITPLNAQTNVSAETNSTVWVVPEVVREINQIKERQFVAFDSHYAEAKAERVSRLRVLGKKVFSLEASGQNIQCAHGILNELVWLLMSTADFKRMDARLRDLELSLASLESKPATAAYGTNEVIAPECLTEWFDQMSWAYEHQKENKLPVLLDRINSPEKLTAYLTAMSVSDISRTGVDHWREFNEALSLLIRMVVRDGLPGYDFHPGLKETLLDLVLHRFRDPTTGYWGERYVISGHEQFIPDLSTTFHIVSYLKGAVPDLNKIVATTLATKDMDTPVGWLYNGHVYNHNSMDVVELFKWGWPHATAEQKQAIAVELQKLIRLCLTESLQPNGSFKRSEADASIEEGTYFGAEFLARAGFFDKSKRFWTDQEFPEAEEIRQRILGFVEKHRASGATGGVYYDSVLGSLKK
jgi:hypothetical protein